MRKVVFDVEIAKTIEQCSNGWASTDEMGVGVAVVYDYGVDRFRIYGPEEVDRLREHLLNADEIGGYNIWGFDYPVVWGYSRDDWANVTEGEIGKLKDHLLPCTNDILRRIWLSKGLNPGNFVPQTHGGYKLDDVAGLTIASKKIGFGGDAPAWYQEGLIQQVANYCVDDVAIERELGEFVDKYGYVIDPKTSRQLPVTAHKGV